VVKRLLVLLLFAIVVAISGALAVWLVLGGAQPGATSAGPPSEINEIPLYTGTVNVEKGGEGPADFASMRYEVDAEVAAVDTYYMEELSHLGWQSDWADFVRVGGDSVNLDWQAPKYDDTIRRHFYRLGERRNLPYDVSTYIVVSDNRRVSRAAARTRVEISLVRVPRLDEVPVMRGAADVERAGHLTTYRITATVEELTDYYTQLLPRHGWTLRGTITEPRAGEDMPGTLYFHFTSHGFSGTLRIKAEHASGGNLIVNMRASGSGLTPKQ
jgi:hypothetical protein